MCGISAIVRFAGNAGDDLPDLERMHRSLVHRGPDAEGAFFVTAGFEGRRLQHVPSSCSEGSGHLRAIAAEAERYRVLLDGSGSDEAYSSRVNRLLYREARHTNIPAVLMYSDRNAMAHSVEARFPFFDHRIVEFCFSLPASYKVAFGRRKRLLRETSEDYLPPSVVDRKDKKFFVLLSNWMPLSEHRQAIRDASRNAALRKLPWVDAARLHRLVDDYLAHKHNNAYAVWRTYTASRWLELHGL